MKKILLLILTTILMLSMAGIAVASNITNAEYKTTIVATNNSTATTNVAVPFTLSTPEMIAVGMLSTNASDAAMISGGGSDTAFMPASDNSSPWITWVSSIGTDSQVQQLLYSKEASGGKIRYFPGDAGMSANDSANLELGDNFTIEQKGWIDTSIGGLFQNSPTGFIDPDSQWAQEENAYDSDNSTDADTAVPATSWGSYLELTLPASVIVGVHYQFDGNVAINATDIDIFNGSWVDAYQGTFTHEVWETKTIASSNVTKARIRFYNTDVGSKGANIDEFEFAGTSKLLIDKGTAFATYISSTGNVTSVINLGTSITAAGISSGEHTIKTQANDTFLGIGVLGDDSTAGLPISDNLVMNAPLWQPEFNTDPITSKDTNALSANITSPTWTSDGYVFDGSDYITFGNPAELQVTGSLTFEAWIKVDASTADWQGIITKHDHEVVNEAGIELKVSPGSPVDGVGPERSIFFKCHQTDAVFERSWSNDLITYGEWTHVAGVFNSGSQIVILINGVRSSYNSTAMTTLQNTPQECLVGAEGGVAGPRREIDGTIGEARIYQKALSDAEVLAQYNATKWKYNGSSDYFDYELSGGANVTDNSENWTYYANMEGYWEYTKIWIGDTLQQHIEWEYNAVEFTDLSGNDHNVAPTFRTTSSNANVSAEVSQQEGLVTGSTPSSNVSGGWTMITSALEAPENLFSEGGDAYAVGDFDIGGLVTDYAADAGHPPEPYHFLLAFGLALIVILGVYGFTHGSRMKRQGSLSLAFFAGGLVLIAFYRFETIPGWTLIPYGLGAILLIMWRRTPSPVD